MFAQNIACVYSIEPPQGSYSIEPPRVPTSYVLDQR